MFLSQCARLLYNPSGLSSSTRSSCGAGLLTSDAVNQENMIAQLTVYEILRRGPSRYNPAKDRNGYFPSRHVEQSNSDEYFPRVVLYGLCLARKSADSALKVVV